MKVGPTNRTRVRTGTAAGVLDDDARLRAFEAEAVNSVALPADAHVIGQPVTVTHIRYPELPRVGLLAACEHGGRSYDVNLAEIVFAPGSPGADVVARYREWLGFVVQDVRPSELARPHRAATDDIVLGRPVDLVVLSCKSNALRCRLLGTAREVTLRTAVRDEIPGAIVTVTPTKQWTHTRHPYLSGKVTDMRFDVTALALVPLALHEQGDWNPAEGFWREEGEPIEVWAKPIIARGPRPMFEMEQVIPGADPDDFGSDPIIEASELRMAGDALGAYALLTNLLAKDLRCLDAYAHLGNHTFDRDPEEAMRYYEMGTAIGALSLGAKFDGVLAWGLVDNRPFLRCLHGAGLCAWRLGDRRTARAVFEKMLWLNPSDNQGARFNLAAVETGMAWEEMEDGER